MDWGTAVYLTAPQTSANATEPFIFVQHNNMTITYETAIALLLNNPADVTAKEALLNMKKHFEY